MRALVLLMVLSLAGLAAESAEVPADVLTQAAQIEAAAAKAKAPVAPLAPPPPPMAETLKIADEIDVLLLSARVLLDQQEPTKGGDRFISAVTAMQGLPRTERKALGARYVEQRKLLNDLAQRLLADPAVAAALAAKDEAVPIAAPEPVPAPKPR